MAVEPNSPNPESLAGSSRFIQLSGMLLLALVGIGFVLFGRLNHDEGWYLYASRLVYDGALPYRDFPFYQAPLLPFVYGLPQVAVPGVETGRWTSFFVTTLTFALGSRLAWARGGRLALGVFFAGILGSPLALWSLHSTRTEPLCALFLTAAMVFLFARGDRARFGALAVAAGGLAAMTRISLLPAALLIAAFAWLRCEGAIARRSQVVAPLLVLFVVVGGIAAVAGFDRVWENVFVIQAERFEQFREVRPLSFDAWVTTRLHFFQRVWAEFGAVSCVAGVAALGSMAARLFGRSNGAMDPAVREASIVGSVALLALLPNLIPRSAYTVYFTSILPIVLIAGGWSLAALARWTYQRGWEPRIRFALALGAVAGLAVFQVDVFTKQFDVWIARDPSDLERLEEARALVEAEVSPVGPLVTFDTYLAVETGRRVPPGFEMGVFSWFPRRAESDGDRFGLLTNDRLAAAFDAPQHRVVALSDVSLGVLATRSHNGFRPRHVMTERELWAAHPPLQRFRLVATLPTFGQLQAPLYLLETDADP